MAPLFHIRPFKLPRDSMQKPLIEHAFEAR